MLKLSEYQQYVNDYLSKLEYPETPHNLYEPIKYTMEQGGKRLRPTLVLATCEAFGKDWKHAIYPAIGMEIFHNFTLIHDDIMDKAPIRRGVETVYKKWNPNIAILAGDTMFAIASNCMVNVDSAYIKPVVEVFNKTAIEICEGQQLDLDFETMENVSIDDYINMIRLKTSVFLGACMLIGATIADANENDCNLLYDFGVNLGLAFQLRDDLLDIYSNTSVFGKINGGDILSAKKTFVYLKALELLGEDKRLLSDIYMSTQIEDTKKIKKVTQIYNDLDIKSVTEKFIEKYSEKAINRLQNTSLSNDNKEFFINLTNDLIKREY
ncbi:MAG: polyprenyl synthetase family protein [Bacteroidales bacterium]|jgi:geranylgeranyl diphosphate synthase type II